MALKNLIVVCVLFCIPLNMTGQKGFYLETLTGGAFCLPSVLKIHQEGHPDIVLKARYKVKPLSLPIYYSLRAGFGINESLSLEIELNHLKIILTNNTDEIQHFAVTHGYNQLWLNLLKEFLLFDARVGFGPVIAHPENTVRAKELSETGGLFNHGYHIDGITSQLALQKRKYLSRKVFLVAEIKLNVSFTQTDVVDGYANISVFAFHGLMGAGISF